MSSKWECPRCGAVSSTKQNLRNHLRKKKICKPIINNVDRELYINTKLYPSKNEINKSTNIGSSINKPMSSFIKKDIENDNSFECSICKKLLSSRQSRWRHEQNCTQPVTIEEPPSINIPTDTTVLLQLQMKLEAKDTIIDELKSQIEVLLKNQGNNNIHNTTQYNIDVKINSFGKENTSYITSEYIKNLISSGPLNTIPKLLEHIHFNPDHTENHNVKIPNKKQNYAQIFNGITWEYRDKQETISNMSDRAYGILNEHYQHGSNTYMDEFKQGYDSNEKKLIKRLTKDTELMILNNQTDQ